MMSSHPQYGSSYDHLAAFAELGKILHGAQPLHDTLQRVAELAKEVLPELREVSVTLIENDKPRTVVFTGPLAVDLDERQYAAGFGPCTDAAIAGGTIVVDTADSTVYPEFAAVCVRRGIKHVVSVGMPVPLRTVGGLNMYSDYDDAIPAESVQLAETFAGYAGVALANAALYHSTLTYAEDMTAAMHSRAVIEQAKGIVMAQQHCSSEEAFATLTRVSQSQNKKLRDLAEQIVDAVQNSK